ncbi:MAG: NAD-dependent epimerase/dehydratase family protein [Ruminococcus sp.]|nr:NAD-dependent epimerase/dehydratase family protein [Ruminococcus sp.]
MKILVTGGTVFVSRYTAEYFVKKGHDVYVLNRNTRPQSENVTLINCNRHNIGEKLKNICFDAVIDVTAYNETDIKDILNSVGDFGSYIMISSSAVYPETNSQPFTENQECGFNIHWEDYGTNKINAEKYLTEKFPDAYIIRPPYLYGKMNNLYREAFVFECAEKNMPFFVPENKKMKLQFFDIEDLCLFIEKIIANKPQNHIFNVGNPETVTIEEWVKLCYGVLGKIPDIRCVKSEINQRMYFPFRNYEYILDVTKQKKFISDIKPLETGLKQSYEWYVNNRELIVRKDYLQYIKDNLMECDLL